MNRYRLLTAAANLIAWARGLVTDLNTRDVAIEERLKAIEARLDAGGL